MSELPIRVLIADDEEIARMRLVRLLAGVLDVEVVGECRDGKEVLEWLSRDDEGVDVLLLDIRMPGLTGLEAKALMPEDGPYVIFTTAHEEHALAAFEVGAVDYLLKPVDAARLQRALARARRTLGGAGGGDGDEGEGELDGAPPVRGRGRAEAAEVDRIAVTTRQGIVLLDPGELSHAIFDGELVTLHTSRGPILCDFSLQDLEQRLGGDPWVRVHRRALLDLRRIDRLEPLDTGGFDAHTRDGARVPVSRQMARRLRKRFGVR